MNPELQNRESLITDLFNEQNYVDAMKSRMGIQGNSKRSGVIKEVAETLKVHSTFLSQILGEKSHLSLEQAIRFAEWAKFSREEIDYFVLLVQRARAGTPALESYFSEKIEAIRSSRMTVRSRVRVQNELSFEDQARYYETWVNQAVHFLVQIPKYRKTALIASALQVSKDQIELSVKLLLELGILSSTPQGWVCNVQMVHLDQSSPLHRGFLSGWRIKTIEDLGRGLDPNGLRYSSVVTLSSEAVEQIKELILKCIEESRAVIGPSESQELHALHFDFYRLDAVVSSSK